MNADLNEMNRELETIGAERTMSLMALTVADRIRNPSAMIGGRCKRLLAKEIVSETIRESLFFIVEGAEKLEQIVKDFETMFKNRQSKFKREDINRVIESVLHVLEKEAELKGIDFLVRLSTDALIINMQRELLRVSIFHLLKNALEATSRGGTVKVETFTENGNVLFTVADTGYGIVSEDIDNVFKTFVSSKEHGFGMGLPLVKQIITEHLGKINVSSGPGTGTEFRLSFPTIWKEGSLL
ncbi:MAG: HAMP domain-containing histidine kinase [Nitrospira sp.]|nr:HAMP domain-containing histidine kinase [Nitrospira sp.]